MGKSKGIIGLISGVFRIGNVGTTNFQEVLDEHAECCAGVNCCKQVLILKDQVTGDRYVGYFKNGTWTTKTLEHFNTDGA